MEYIMKGSVILDDKKQEYEVLDSIGSGGFGIIYKIKRKKDGKLFALKTLQIGFSDKRYLDSFKHEGESAMTISNENVVGYLFFHDGMMYKESPPYIIMEYANDGDLSKYIKDQKEFLSNSQIKLIFTQLISGMKAINEKIIHRDLKPANILFSDGKFKITDFGLSKIFEDDTRTSTFKGSGTYSYMSPEAWKLEKNTPLMDIYSMGLIFYEIATRNHPFNKEKIQNVNDWRNIHLYKNPEAPTNINSGLSPMLVQLIQKMYAKGHSDRFKSWDEVEEFLKTDDLPETDNSERINEIIKRKVEADSEKTKKILSEQERQKDREEKQNLVEYMFNEKMVIPLENFIEELNKKLTHDKIKYFKNSLMITITFSNGNNIEIECNVIFEEDFIRDVPYEFMGQGKYKRELQMSTLRNKKIIAWGIIKTSSEIGYNLLLVEKEGDLYGQWIILTNKNHVMFQPYKKIEPFYLDYNVLEKNLPLINVMSQVDMKDEVLDMNKIYDIVKDEIV